MFYVYLHKKKTTGEVFYVGKGKGRRINDNSRRSSSWKQVVKSCGIIREYYLTGLQEWYALELEADLIAYYGLLTDGSGTLVNLLSKDERPAGRRYLSGIASPRADKENHLFRNLKTGEEFSGTRYEFQDKYKPKKHFVNHLFIEGNAVSNDWIVVDRFSAKEYKDIVENYFDPAKRKDKTIYTFCNIFSMEEISCTRYDFIEKYKISCSKISSYFNKLKNNDKSTTTFGNGWFVKELCSEETLNIFSSLEKYKKNRIKDKTIYTFLNVETNEKFIGDRFDFKIAHSIDPTPLLKPSSKINILFKWCIPKLLDEETLIYLLNSKGIRNTKGENNYNVDKTIHRLINNETLEIFTGTRIEFKQKFGFKIDALFQKRKRKRVKNWSICP